MLRTKEGGWVGCYVSGLYVEAVRIIHIIHCRVA